MFVRGDVDGNSTVSVADAIYGLNFLFGTADPPSCEDACDTNDDSVINISDMIMVRSQSHVREQVDLTQEVFDLHWFSFISPFLSMRATSLAWCSSARSSTSAGVIESIT